MQKFLQQSIIIDACSLLSFSLFLITGDKFTIPLGLLFLLSLFQEISLFGVFFGLACLSWVIAWWVRGRKLQIIFKGGYAVLALCCIGAIFIGNVQMFKEIPSLVSLVVFLLLMFLFYKKWWYVVMQHPSHLGYSAGK